MGRVVLPTLPQANVSMTQQDIDATLDKARKAFAHKDYATAIPLLTKVLEQPEFPRRAEAQELMGLARERNRQLAHAKAEYEEYLRRYPDGKAVKRVKERLRALAWATRPSRTGAGGCGRGGITMARLRWPVADLPARHQSSWRTQRSRPTSRPRMRY